MGAVAAGLAFVSSMPPAGPGSALVIRWASSGRRRHAVVAGLGCAAGEGLYALVGISGVGLIVERHPALLRTLAVLGVVALVAFAIRCLGGPLGRRAGSTSRVCLRPAREARSPTATMPTRPLRSWLAGLGTALLNPLPLLSWSTTFAMVLSLRAAPESPADRVAFAGGVVVGVFAWLAVLGLIVFRFSQRFGPRFDRWVLRGTGVLMLCAAAGAAVRGVGL